MMINEHRLVRDAKIILEKAKIEWRDGGASIEVMFEAPEKKEDLLQTAFKRFEELGIDILALKGEHILSFDLFMWEDKPLFKWVNTDIG